VDLGGGCQQRLMERDVKASVGGERVRVGKLFYASQDQFETFDCLRTVGMS
jgi:hypothetical protein